MKSKAALQMSLGLILLCTASACSMPEFLGGTRTVPDGAKVDFDNRRAPELNPGGKPALQNIPTAPQAQIMSSSPRKVPVENVAAENTSTIFQQTPITPVTTAPISSPTYPVLATVPQAPQHQAQQTITNNFNSLNSDMTTVKASGKNLMNDKSATVMTSPQTGQLVNNPANAVVPIATNNVVAPAPVSVTLPPATTLATAPTPKTNNDSGVNGWLHNAFGGEKTQAPKPAQIAVPAPAPVVDSKPLPFVAPTPLPVTTQAPTNNVTDKPVMLHKPTIAPEDSAIATPTVTPPLPNPTPVAAPTAFIPQVKIDDDVVAAFKKPEVVPAKEVVEAAKAVDVPKKDDAVKTVNSNLSVVTPKPAPALKTELATAAPTPKPTMDIPATPAKIVAPTVVATTPAKPADIKTTDVKPLDTKPVDDLTAITTPYDQPIALVQPKTETGYLGDSRYTPPSNNNGGN